MRPKSFSTRTLSLPCLKTAGILGRIGCRRGLRSRGNTERIWLLGILVTGLTF